MARASAEANYNTYNYNSRTDTYSVQCPSFHVPDGDPPYVHFTSDERTVAATISESSSYLPVSNDIRPVGTDVRTAITESDCSGNSSNTTTSEITPLISVALVGDNVSNTLKSADWSDGEQTITLSDQYTEEAWHELLDTQLASLSYPSMQGNFTAVRGYRLPLYQFQYAIPTGGSLWLPDEAAFEQAKQDRIDADEALLGSAETSLTEAQEDLQQLQTDLTEAEAELVVLLDEKDEALSRCQEIREEVAELDAERLGLVGKRDNEDLSEAEVAALNAQIAGLQEDIVELMQEFEDYPFNDPFSEDSGIYPMTDIWDKEKQIQLLENKTIPEAWDLIELWTLRAVEYQARLTAAQVNLGVYTTNYSLNNSASTGASFAGNPENVSTSRSKSKMRYRVRVNLGDYDTTGGTQVLLRWSLRISGDPVEFVPKQEVVNVGDGEHYAMTEWQEIGTPDGIGVTVSLAGADFVFSGILHRQLEWQGRRNWKRGVFGYDVADKPKMYKRETFSGGFAGCPEQELDSKNYSGVRELNAGQSNITFTTPASGDLSAARAASNFPIGFNYRVGRAFSNLLTPTGPERFDDVFSQTDTERVYRRAVACGAGEVLDTLVSTLSDEFTTQELRDSVDVWINDDEFDEWDEPTWNTDEAAISFYFDAWEPVFYATDAKVVRLLSPDELTYTRFRIRFSFGITFSVGLTGKRPSDPFTVPVKYRVTTTSHETGTQTTTEHLVSLDFPREPKEDEDDEEEVPPVVTSASSGWIMVEAAERESKVVSWPYLEGPIIIDAFRSSGAVVDPIEENLDP